MKKLIYSLLLALFITTAGATFTNSIAKPNYQEEKEKKEVTVYVTKTGSKYHRDGCQYLRQSKIAMKKKDAIEEGYGACSKCKP